MTVRTFGTQSDGQTIRAIFIENDGLSVTILTRGAIVQDVRLRGVDHSLTLGSESLAAYEGPMAFFGALVGPVANRIGGARVTIDGRTFHFETVDKVNTLHSGSTGTHARVWEVADHSDDFVELTLELPDGLGGFPGNRTITARYTVSSGACLVLNVTATTDQPTIMNIANHSYWNLDSASTIEGHTLAVDASEYLQLDEKLVPKAKASVDNTHVDFRQPKKVGQISETRVDNNLCLQGGKTRLRPVAKLTGRSGVSLTLETTEAGLQVYEGEFLDTAPFVGHTGVPYQPLSGIAMEAQGWPDAPNHPEFPPIDLAPGQIYSSSTKWQFHLPKSA